MYSNDIEQIKSGLTNYVGASIMALHTNPKYSAKQTSPQYIISALLMEQIINMAKQNSNIINFEAFIPVLKSTMVFLEQQSKLMASDNDINNSTKKNSIMKFQLAIDILKEILASHIKEVENKK